MVFFPRQFSYGHAGVSGLQGSSRAVDHLPECVDHLALMRELLAGVVGFILPLLNVLFTLGHGLLALIEVGADLRVLVGQPSRIFRHLVLDLFFHSVENFVLDLTSLEANFADLNGQLVVLLLQLGQSLFPDRVHNPAMQADSDWGSQHQQTPRN